MTNTQMSYHDTMEECYYQGVGGLLGERGVRATVIAKVEWLVRAEWQMLSFGFNVGGCQHDGLFLDPCYNTAPNT